MAETRFRYALGRTEWLRLKREVPIALAGAVLAIVAVALWGSDAGLGDTILAAGATFLGAFVLVPLAQLVWHFWDAPYQVVREEAASLREEIGGIRDAAGAAGASGGGSVPTVQTVDTPLHVELLSADQRGAEIEVQATNSPIQDRVPQASPRVGDRGGAHPRGGRTLRPRGGVPGTRLAPGPFT